MDYAGPRLDNLRFPCAAAGWGEHDFTALTLPLFSMPHGGSPRVAVVDDHLCVIECFVGMPHPHDRSGKSFSHPRAVFVDLHDGQVRGHVPLPVDLHAHPMFTKDGFYVETTLRLRHQPRLKDNGDHTDLFFLPRDCPENPLLRLRLQQRGFCRDVTTHKSTLDLVDTVMLRDFLLVLPWDHLPVLHRVHDGLLVLNKRVGDPVEQARARLESKCDRRGDRELVKHDDELRQRFFYREQVIDHQYDDERQRVRHDAHAAAFQWTDLTVNSGKIGAAYDYTPYLDACFWLRPSSAMFTLFDHTLRPYRDLKLQLPLEPSGRSPCYHCFDVLRRRDRVTSALLCLGSRALEDKNERQFVLDVYCARSGEFLDRRLVPVKKTVSASGNVFGALCVTETLVVVVVENTCYRLSLHLLAGGELTRIKGGRNQ